VNLNSEAPGLVPNRFDLHASCSRAGYEAARAGRARIANPYAMPPPFPCIEDPPQRRSMAEAWARGWQRGWRERVLSLGRASRPQPATAARR
jgi:hypothetical protein